MKQNLNIGTEIGKDRIHDGHYTIVENGRDITINVWCHGGHAVRTYQVKGVKRDAYDDGEIGNILREAADHLAAYKRLASKWGIDFMAVARKGSVRTPERPTIQSANETAKPRRFIDGLKDKV